LFGKHCAASQQGSGKTAEGLMLQADDAMWEIEGEFCRLVEPNSFVGFDQKQMTILFGQSVQLTKLWEEMLKQV
jgi:hypothetical protein